MSKPKILLVDDEESVRMSGQLALENWFSVITAETTAKALELLKRERFDLVILDMLIKDEGPESGIEALKIIHREYPGLPVIIISGTVTWMQKWDELKQFGAAGYLSKPFERTKIKELIERCLTGHEER